MTRKSVWAFLFIIGIILIVWGLSIGWDSTFGSPEREAMTLRIVPGGFLFAMGLIGVTLGRGDKTPRLPHP